MTAVTAVSLQSQWKVKLVHVVQQLILCNLGKNIKNQQHPFHLFFYTYMLCMWKCYWNWIIRSYMCGYVLLAIMSCHSTGWWVAAANLEVQEGTMKWALYVCRGGKGCVKMCVVNFDPPVDWPLLHTLTDRDHYYALRIFCPITIYTRWQSNKYLYFDLRLWNLDSLVSKFVPIIGPSIGIPK